MAVGIVVNLVITFNYVKGLILLKFLLVSTGINTLHNRDSFVYSLKQPPNKSRYQSPEHWEVCSWLIFQSFRYVVPHPARYHIHWLPWWFTHSVLWEWECWSFFINILSSIYFSDKSNLIWFIEPLFITFYFLSARLFAEI